MAKNRKTAFGAPAEQKEVVVTVDRRLLVGLGLIGLFGVALLAGALFARLQASARPGAPLPAAAPAAVPAAVDGVAAATRAAQLGLPSSVQIVTNTLQQLDPQEAAAAATQAAAPPLGALGAQPGAPAGTAMDPLQEALSQDPNAVQLDLSGRRKVADASQWDHDVLANFEDPNVTDPNYAPVRAETVDEPLDGPRLGLTELNGINTFDFGLVSMTQPVQHDFEVVNVGSEDLKVSRVYTGCGCTATRLGSAALDAAGWVVGADGRARQPMTLRPGQRERVTVEFDPRAEGKSGSQAKFVQIFSNDPTKARFDDADPLSHETRFRFVVQPDPSVQ
jgi:hypothetical protein